MTGDEIQGKLAILRENLQRLAQIPQGSLQEFQSDFRNVDSALHRLQTSIQALIDLASQRLGHLGLGAARSGREVLEKLEGAGRLPAGSTSRYAPIFGFRNRVVHLYDRIDAAIVYRILTEERDDIAELADLLLAIRRDDAPPAS